MLDALQLLLGLVHNLADLVAHLLARLLLLLVQVMFGVLARSAPSLNIFALGLPLGMLAGLAGLVASAPLVADAMGDLVALALGQAQAMLAPLPPVPPFPLKG